MIGWKPILALLLLVPAPSIGVLAAMIVFPDSTQGRTIFTASKLWLFVFPVLWLKFVEHGRFSISPPKNGGWLAALFSGIVFGLLVIFGYLGFGSSMFDRSLFTSRLMEIGLGSWPIYAAGAAYWILVNSVLEEYVWRWFVYEKCEALVRPRLAVVLSALFFTLHHYIALQVFLTPMLALISSLGVFVGGAAWSYLYMRYRSIWPGYLSHAIVDLFVFGLGAAMLFAAL